MLFFAAAASVSPLSSPPFTLKADITQPNQTMSEASVSRYPSAKAPYSELVKSYAREYGIDYRFVLGLIKQESQFNAEAVSERGAFGLMQIMPVTGNEISGKIKLKNIDLPRGNIHAGIYYFRKIYRLFQSSDEDSRLRLSLAAYYAGPGRIYDAQEVAAYMGENPSEWASIKNALPLLSKRYYSLHRSVWSEGKPPSGYFGGWSQTLSYVESVMDNYEEYRKVIH